MSSFVHAQNFYFVTWLVIWKFIDLVWRIKNDLFRNFWKVVENLKIFPLNVVQVSSSMGRLLLNGMFRYVKSRLFERLGWSPIWLCDSVVMFHFSAFRANMKTGLEVLRKSIRACWQLISGDNPSHVKNHLKSYYAQLVSSVSSYQVTTDIKLESAKNA